MPDLPIQQSQKEFEHMARLQQERARDRQITTAQEAGVRKDEQQNINQSATSQKTAPFPMGMLGLAVVFDLIGIIPFVNFVSEPIAGLVFGFWQKRYAPKTNPIATFIVAKVVDTISIGILPSNIGIVVFAYSKKKVQNVV